MKNILKIWLYLCLYLLFSTPAVTACKNCFNKHIIILIDGSGTMSTNKPIVQGYLSKFLTDFASSQSTKVSVLFFGIPDNNMNFNKLINVENSIFEKNIDQDELQTYIANIDYSFFKNYWTGLTLALPNSIFAFPQKNNLYKTTEIILITDGIFNSLDPNHELISLANVGISGLEEQKIRLASFNKIYHFEALNEEVYQGLKVKKYRLNPNIISDLDIISTISLTNFNDSSFYAKRQPNGFMLTSSLNSTNPKFLPKEIRYSVFQENKVVHSDTTLFPLKDRNSNFINYRFTNDIPASTIKINFTSQYMEAIYGKQLIHALNCKGFSKIYNIVPEKQLKILFLLPLYPKLYKIANLFGFRDQSNAILFWNIISFLSLGVIGLYIFFRYIKNNKTIVDPTKIIIK